MHSENPSLFLTSLLEPCLVILPSRSHSPTGANSFTHSQAISVSGGPQAHLQYFWWDMQGNAMFCRVSSLRVQENLDPQFSEEFPPSSLFCLATSQTIYTGTEIWSRDHSHDGSPQKRLLELYIWTYRACNFRKLLFPVQTKLLLEASPQLSWK